MTAFLFLLMVAPTFAADSALDAKMDLKWQPKCAEVRLDDWVKSFNSCYQVTGSHQSCKCVADGLILSSSCAEFKKYENSKVEQDKVVRRLASACKPKN